MFFIKKELTCSPIHRTESLIIAMLFVLVIPLPVSDSVPPGD